MAGHGFMKTVFEKQNQIRGILSVETITKIYQMGRYQRFYKLKSQADGDTGSFAIEHELPTLKGSCTEKDKRRGIHFVLCVSLVG